MAIAAVQRVGKGGTGASVAIGSGDGWSTPTAGNLLVAFGNSDATLTISPSGWTAGPSIIDGNGAYAWYKVAAGTESTITITPSVSDDAVLVVAEYSGAAGSPFDAQNSSTIAGSDGTTTTSASVTTTQSGDLVVAAALLHSFSGGSAPTSPSWTNSFTQRVSAASAAGTGASRCITLVGDLLPAGSAGSYSTAASWTNNAADRQEIILAFKAAAGSSGVDPVIRRRQHRGLYLR